MPVPALEPPPKYNCEAPCLIFKRKQQCIFIHSMHCAHACVYMCTYALHTGQTQWQSTSVFKLPVTQSCYSVPNQRCKQNMLECEIHIFNKITFQRTRSLSNAVCFCHQFLTYLTCNFDNAELGLFTIIQCQRSWCQSKAHLLFPI